MIFNALTLLVITLVAGLSIFLFKGLSNNNFKIVLSFSGAYLFSITLIHILPELFHEAEDIRIIGSFVLAGFFIQMILEYFSSGIEHGHMHVHHHEGEHHHHHLNLGLLIALCIHSLLEGTLLVHPFHDHGHDESHSLLWGLSLHKVPEAIALATVVFSQLHNKTKTILVVLFYAAMSPLGLLMSGHIFEQGILDSHVIQYLFAIVAGNFLNISTTIFFEAVPDHKFRANKLAVFLLAAITAFVIEVLL